MLIVGFVGLTVIKRGSMNTKVLSCKCAHKHQDQLHGKDNRVFNKCKPQGTQPVYRCTVCAAERASKD